MVFSSIFFYFWFSSRLVGEILVNFQRKVALILESICLTLNDLYLAIHSFEFPGVNCEWGRSSMS